MMKLNSNHIKGLLQSFAQTMHDERDYLIEIDGIFGDSDLGITMDEGFTAAFKAIEDLDEKDIGKLLYFAGKAMSSKVPSTMGTLMATGLMTAGKSLRDHYELDLAGITAFVDSYLAGVMKMGKAEPGEKTFIDGWLPAVESLKNSVDQNSTIKTAMTAAAQAAEQGFENTSGMIAVHGRAAIRGEKSREAMDPGAAVAMLLMRSFSGYVNSV